MVTRLAGGLTPADGADPRTFPAIWNNTATSIESLQSSSVAYGTAITALQGSAVALGSAVDVIEAWDLDDINDVTVTSPTDGQVLSYSTAVSGWVNEDVAAGGLILQVVSAETATQTNTTSTSLVNTAASVTITPSSTSSKILVFGYAGLFQTGGNTGAKLTLARDTTSIGQESTLYTGAAAIVPAHLQVLDSPATTSPVTYRLRLRTQNASFTASAAFHVMTAMEVAG